MTVREPTLDYQLREPTLVDAKISKQLQENVTAGADSEEETTTTLSPFSESWTTSTNSEESNSPTETPTPTELCNTSRLTESANSSNLTEFDFPEAERLLKQDPAYSELPKSTQSFLDLQQLLKVQTILCRNNSCSEITARENIACNEVVSGVRFDIVHNGTEGIKTLRSTIMLSKTEEGRDFVRVLYEVQYHSLEGFEDFEKRKRSFVFP